jgi:CRP-like cAMP-binding protein
LFFLDSAFVKRIWFNQPSPFPVSWVFPNAIGHKGECSMTLSNSLSQPENKLLASLSRRSYERLIPHLELVIFELGQVLYNPKQKIKHAYFPHRTTISIVQILEDGSTVEAAVVGSEGMVGTPLLSGDDISPNQAIVQIADGGVRMKAETFQEEVKSNTEFNELVHRYLQALFTQILQTGACNRLHPVAERLARWLLLCQDRMESDTLFLTHEFIATMLGARRAGVSVAANILQTAGIISYHRGKVIILDREALEEAACECYRTNCVVHRLLSKCCQDKNGDVVSFFLCSQLLYHLDSGEYRHVDVGNYQVWMLSPRQRQAFLTIGGKHDVEPFCG